MRRFLLSIIPLASLLSPCFATDYRLQTLETAHDLFRSATNTAMYAEAAKQYEYLVDEEGIRNGHLFYSLGNCWFMAGDFGRAILNYRRAEQYLPGDADLEHNLDAAIAMRTDLIPEKAPASFAAKLLGWHLNTPAPFRWWLFACCWLLFWGACFWMRRSSKKEPRIVALATGILSLVLLVSLATEAVMAAQSKPGVIVEDEVLARKGDGQMYAPAFTEPLHGGTEFRRFEKRGEWWHVRLADGRACWIPARAAKLVDLTSE